MKKIMGTGSRSMIIDPNALTIYKALESHILFLNETEPVTLISGMAEGWDEAIAKIGMRNNIPYIAAVPNKGYGDYYWGRNSLGKVNRMETFRKLLAHAQEVVVVCDSIYVYQNGIRIHANFVRNQWMVDNCDSALAYNPTSSGTRDAIARLKTAKKPYEVYPFNTQGKLTF